MWPHPPPPACGDLAVNRAARTTPRPSPSQLATGALRVETVILVAVHNADCSATLCCVFPNRSSHGSITVFYCYARWMLERIPRRKMWSLSQSDCDPFFLNPLLCVWMEQPGTAGLPVAPRRWHRRSERAGKYPESGLPAPGCCRPPAASFCCAEREAGGTHRP